MRRRIGPSAGRARGVCEHDILKKKRGGVRPAKRGIFLRRKNGLRIARKRLVKRPRKSSRIDSERGRGVTVETIINIIKKKKGNADYTSIKKL